MVFALDLHACELKTGAVSADHFNWQQHLLGLKDHQGNTALHLAAIEGLPETVQLLLQAGADTTTVGETAPFTLSASSSSCICLYPVYCLRAYYMQTWDRCMQHGSVMFSPLVNKYLHCLHCMRV